MDAIKIIEPCGISGVMVDAGVILQVGSDVSPEDAKDLIAFGRAIEAEAEAPATKGRKGADA